MDSKCIIDEFMQSDNFKLPEIKSNSELELSNSECDWTLKLRRSDFIEEKDLNSFIKKCEALVRRSPEYQEWGRYLREVFDAHVCSITDEIDAETSVEIHHHPMTLYDIVKSIVLRKIDNNEEFCSFDISMETITLHFSNSVGIVPLITSMHQKYHNGFLDIPMEMVLGDYKEWMDKYSSYLNEEDLKKIQCRLDINKKSCNWIKHSWSRNSYSKDKD